MTPVLKAHEAAELLDCSVETINEKCAAGELPGVKFGRSWILPAEALVQRLNELAQATKRTPQRPAAVVEVLRTTPGAGRRRPPPALPALGA